MVLVLVKSALSVLKLLVFVIKRLIIHSLMLIAGSIQTLRHCLPW